ncbi:Maf1 regulator-domain-containing protein [Flagelloscypha sp. PMI_526]|nr:Maf1 regulator-domain-containing protein [Flagelloscypha sp. PMI_526]
MACGHSSVRTWSTQLPLNRTTLFRTTTTSPSRIMKYIENPELADFARKLELDSAECSVHARIEAYSCKHIKRDKKLFKALEVAYQDEASHSPPLPSWLDRDEETTPFGPFDKHDSRKTLYLLIATLNLAFDDYDFSDVRPAQFTKEDDAASVLNSLSNNYLLSGRGTAPSRKTFSAYPPSNNADFFPSSIPSSSSPYDSIISSPNAPAPAVSGTHPEVYNKLDDVIGIADCEVFSYVPDVDADPHANDLDDDEDDVASVGDEDSSDDDDFAFEFEDEKDNLDEFRPKRGSSGRRRGIAIPPTPRKSSMDSSHSNDSSFSGQIRHKRRGPLLWSSYWFFLNRKQKRILFINLWSRSKRPDPLLFLGGNEEGASWSSLSSSLPKNDRFLGWDDSFGLGARSLPVSLAA